MSDVGGGLSRSQIEECNAEHLYSAATQWSSTAEQCEDHFTIIHRSTLASGGTQWDGLGGDGARDRTFADLVKVRGIADRLHAASSIARDGADELDWARRAALDAIVEAEEAGFTVGEDLSVTDRQLWSSLLRASATRQSQAEALAAEISSRAKTLATVDKKVAAKLSTALAPLAEMTFKESPAVQAVGYDFKTDIDNEQNDPFHRHDPETVHPGGTGGEDPKTGAQVLPGEGEGGGGERGDLEHARELGIDPSNGQFRASESEAGLRVERELGVRLTRADDPSVDWVDAKGTTYDAVGPFPAKFFDQQWPQLQNQIHIHVGKADIVPVDVSLFSPEQQTIVRSFVNGLNNPKVVVIGGTP